MITVNITPDLTAWQSELIAQLYARTARLRPAPPKARPSHAESARARRLATERNRRNRRRQRAGRPSVVSPPYSPFRQISVMFGRRNGVTSLMQQLGAAAAAAAAAAESVRRVRESFAALQVPMGVLQPSLSEHIEAAAQRRDVTHYDRYRTTDDATTSRDSQDCSSSSGGRWSDLMAQIDDLVGSDLEASDA